MRRPTDLVVADDIPECGNDLALHQLGRGTRLGLPDQHVDGEHVELAAVLVPRRRDVGPLDRGFALQARPRGRGPRVDGQPFGADAVRDPPAHRETERRPPPPGGPPRPPPQWSLILTTAPSPGEPELMVTYSARRPTVMPPGIGSDPAGRSSWRLSPLRVETA